MDYRIITIGCLSRHDLWGEKVSVRAAHSTTTLVRSGNQIIVVDPGLPPTVIANRIRERSGINPEAVTDVFLTNFRPSHRRGLSGFPNANWYISEMERESVGKFLSEQYRSEKDPQLKLMIEEDLAVLSRCKPAPDRLAEQVDLFPLPGYTPGTCGLMLCQINSTTLVAGDAVPTVEHMEQRQILRNCFDSQQAKESFLEAIEIADVIIPGHDNLLLNPSRMTV